MNLDVTIKGLAEIIRGAIADTQDEATTNLRLSPDEFVKKMYLEHDGEALLELMASGEISVCERLGLVSTDEVNEGVIIVPRWGNLVAHLRIVNRA